MIRFMTPSDAARIVPLWQACFGDDENYIRYFLQHAPSTNRGLLAEEDGRAVSMLFLLPGALELDGQRLPASYVYAVATAEDFRGRGLAAELIRHSAAITREEGQAALCLFPATERLYRYYEKLGFRTAFARQAHAFTRETGELPYLKTNLAWDAEQACARRSARWGRQGFFAWDAPMLDYIRQETLFNGGRVRCAEEGYIFYGTADALLKVKECCAQPGAEEWLLQKALSISGCAHGEALLAAEKESLPGGMLYPLDDRAEQWLAATAGKAYLGLTLD